MQPESRLILGDALDELRGLADGSVDAVVTDPPSGIAFMGKDWDRDKGGRRDWIDWLSSVLAECLRVARPGARMLCWALPRTAHWTGMAVEDAGWLIENKCYHLFGQGFPKGQSQLKPAAEEWILARKPGGPVPPLQIDACRVGVHDADYAANCSGDRGHAENRKREAGFAMGCGHASAAGRWPANVVLSHADGCRPAGTRRVKGSNQPGKANGEIASAIGFGDAPGKARRATYHTDPAHYGLETVENYLCVEGCPVRQLDEMSGTLKSGEVAPHHMRRASRQKNGGGYGGNFSDVPLSGFGDSGGASRFFYCAKASRKDRGEGNTHPTVKSTALMSWLCRLIAGPGDVILDPFAGSGSTGKAAILEGMGFLGIECDPAYHAIAAARLAAAGAQPLFPACR